MTTADYVSVETAQVLAELAFFVGKGVQEAMGATLSKFDPAARQFWVEKHLKSIPIALARAAKKGETFDDQRTVVTVEAIKLGRIAAELALTADPTGDPVVIKLAHVEEASKQVNAGAACRAATTSGGGGYCEG